MVELEIVAGIASYQQYYSPVVLNVYKQNFTVYIYPPCLYRGSTPRGGVSIKTCPSDDISMY